MKNIVKRIVAANNYIRGFFSYTKDMVSKASESHNLNPVSTAALGRLLTCTSMMGLMSKSEKDVCTVVIEGDGPMQGLCATTDARGYVKGYVYNNDFTCYAKADGHLDVGGAIGNGKLTVIKDLGLKEPYNSTVPLLTGEIGEDLTYYFATSEQIGTSVGAGVLFDKETAMVSHAGGFIVQITPNTPEEVILKLEENLSEVRSVTDFLRISSSVDELIETIFRGLEHEVTEEYSVDFYCDCCEDKIISKLTSLPGSQLEEIFSETDEIEVKCEMCGAKYLINKDKFCNLQKINKN